MKRQNSLLSTSSSRGEISSDNFRYSKTFGCLSGIAHFLSKNQRSRKRCITFANRRRQEIDEASSLSETGFSPHIPQSSERETAIVPRNSSFNAPASPAPAPEFQRSESVISTNFRATPGPVARLMGLESCTDGAGRPTAVAETTEIEKQRQITVALRKCEHDLRAIKKFIDAIEAADGGRSSPAEKIEEGSGGSDRELMFWEQQPSPVSVLDELTRPRHFSDVSGDDCMFFQRPSANSGKAQPQRRQQMQRKKAGKENIVNLSEFVSIRDYSLKKPAESPLEGSKGMKECVEEVCRDSKWGQRREETRLGVALQHQICGELIEEFVEDLKYSYSACSFSSLPIEACKRRLCF